MPSLDDSDDDPHRQVTLVLSRSIGQKKSGALLLELRAKRPPGLAPGSPRHCGCLWLRTSRAEPDSQATKRSTARIWRCQRAVGT